MNYSKFIIFVITILSVAVVVFNNATQIIKEVFFPELNVGMWISFGLIVLGTTTYVVVNKGGLK